MKIKITGKFVIAFLALTFVMLELHEIVHTAVGRIICGCWGLRDFNAWEICETCQNIKFAWLSTLAGPVFTFIMIWLGSNYLKITNTNQQKSFGIALIFANTPFGRILNPLLKSGDEATLMNMIIENISLASFITLVIILLITVYPMYKAYKTIENKPIGYFSLLFFAPVFIIILVILVVLNTILSKGILSEVGLLGSPIIVNIWSVFVLLILFMFRKNLYTLGVLKTETDK
jgi:hypothetical protein